MFNRSFVFLISIFFSLFGAFLNFSGSYDYWVHAKSFLNADINFLFNQTYINFYTGFVYDFLMSVFKFFINSYQIFVFFIYFFVFNIVFNTVRELFYKINTNKLLIILIILFSFPYISLFSGQRFILSIVLMNYLLFKSYFLFSVVGPFLHIGVLPFYLINLFANFSISIRHAFLIFICILLLFLIYLNGFFDFFVEPVSNLIYLYLNDPIDSSRYWVYDFLFRLQLLVPIIFIYFSKSKKLNLFIKINFSYLFLMIIFMNNYLLLDRIIISYWLLIPFLYNHLMTYSKVVLIFVLLFSLLRLILLIQSNMNGVYMF